MPMQPIKFYYDVLNQSSRALYIFLEASKIPFEAVPISSLKGMSRKKLIKAWMRSSSVSGCDIYNNIAYELVRRRFGMHSLFFFY